ncbi:MAG: hypothetical protein ACREOZ_02670 [Gloeomargaritales cyanobacterium]
MKFDLPRTLFSAVPVGAARKDENEDYATKHANAELQRLNAELHRVNARLQRQYNDLLVVLEKSKGQQNPTWKEVHDATASREILKAELNLWKRIAAESQFGARGGIEPVEADRYDKSI